MNKMRNVTGKELLRFLVKQGFLTIRVRGSHHFLRKGNRHTVIAVHGNRDVKRGMLSGILRDIKMEPDEFERLWRG